MAELHIAEIGELFSLDDGFDFLSDQNMLEYDFIIIDTDSLIEEVNRKSETQIKKRFKDLKDFVAKKNIPVVFLCATENSFAVLIGEQRTIFEYLALDVAEERCSGKKIENNSNSIFSGFLKVYGTDLEYVVGYSNHPGTSIGNAKSKSLSIGFYTKDFVFLPTITEDSRISNDEFILALYEVCRSIRKDGEVNQFPAWANEYLLPGEKSERQYLESIEAEIIRLNKEKADSQIRLDIFLPLKQLWSGTGVSLENAAKLVFSEIGFSLLPTEHGRDDIIMRWKEQVIIVEVKGQSKSAAEKNAAQLEKWVSMYITDNNTIPKGLLLINTYREQPLAERTQPSFPHQMLKYSTSRDHCLLTTLQLCNLLLYCRSNPDHREAEIEKLINTAGIYEGFLNWPDYIEVIKRVKSGKPKGKKSTESDTKVSESF